MTTGTSDRTPPRRTWHRGLLAACAATLAGAVALVAVVTGGGDREPADSGPAAASVASAEATDSAVPSSAAEPSASVPPPLDGDPAVSAGDPAELPPSLAAVALDDSATVGDGVTGALESVEAVDGTATGPGNVAGPALRVTVRLENGTAEPVALDGAVVTLDHGADRTPASPLDDPAAAPFAGVLQPGDSAVGVYVFTVAEDARESVTVSVGYRPGAPYLVFTGAAD